MRAVPPLPLRWTAPELKGRVTAITGVGIFPYSLVMGPMGSLVHRTSASQREMHPINTEVFT